MALTAEQIEAIPDEETRNEVRALKAHAEQLESGYREQPPTARAGFAAAPQAEPPPKQPSAKEVAQRQVTMADQIRAKLEGDDSPEAAKIRGLLDMDGLDEHQMMDIITQLDRGMAPGGTGVAMEMKARGEFKGEAPKDIYEHSGQTKEQALKS